MNFKATTVVGNKLAFVVIAFLYGIGIIVALYNKWSYWLPTLLAIHFIVDLGLVMGKPVPSKVSLVRFINEAARAIFVGWLMLLGYVFTFGIFLSGDSNVESEKLYGMAFGAGLGLMLVCAPCAIVASICTSYLVRANAPPTPFFGD